jgi:hypothetical protein
MKTNFSKKSPGHRGPSTAANSAQRLARSAKAGPVPLKRRYKIKFRAPRSVASILLQFPAVRAHMVWRERVVLVCAAKAMMAGGKFSLRTAAAALGLSVSQLCLWLQTHAASGDDGLRPKPRRTGKRHGDACKLQIFFCP